MYILQCGDGTYYVGSTRDLDTRMDQHVRNKVPGYTSKRQPVELVYAAEFDTVAEAYAFEKQVQGWSRAKREALIAGRFDLLRGLSGSRYKRDA